MKTEEQVREKLQECIGKYDKLALPSSLFVKTILLGMMEILEWVLDEEEDE